MHDTLQADTLIETRNHKPMSNSPTVSVIIPTYNRPHMLRRLLVNLLNQTTHPLEILVVNDGSDASQTEAICDDLLHHFGQQGVKLICLRNDKGRSAARTRNTGARNASGDILVFVDDDMQIDTGYLGAILQVYENTPDAVGVGAFHQPPLASFLSIYDWRFKMLNTVAKLVGWTHFSANKSSERATPHVLRKTIRCTSLSGATCSYVRSAFEQVMFDERLEFEAFGEDVLLSTEIRRLHLGELYLTPDATCSHDYSYRSPSLQSIHRRVGYFLFVHFQREGFSVGSLGRASIALSGTLASRILRLFFTSTSSLKREIWQELWYTSKGFMFALRHLGKLGNDQIEEFNIELNHVK
jgi:GT2 family glycosyltransferase